jgi:hypothetical protein
MKEGSLFCFVVMGSTKPGHFRSCSSCLWKALDKEGCMGLVPWHLDLWCKSSWILNIFSLKIKLNCTQKFRRNWNVPLVLVERPWWAGMNGIYLVRFGSRIWKILIFKWFLLLKIQINSKKPGFERKNQLRTRYHLNVYHSIQVEGIVMCLWCCWKDLAMGYKYTLQNNVLCYVHPTL